jgi:hypothetical protein
MPNKFFCLWLVVSLPALGAELTFDFADFPADKSPPGFRSTLTGTGKLGEWKVIMDEVPPLLAPLSTKAPTVTRRAVLAQLSQDRTDERFPLLIFDGEVFGDFTLTTRFKLVGGGLEQMAGIAFRIRDEKNFYVVRASGLGRNVRFYKVVDGVRSQPIGPEVEILKGVWHELKIECKGNQVRCWLNGKDAIPPLTDNTFSIGKIGFWTKSDAVSYFTDTKINYIPREMAAKAIVRDAVKKYVHLRGLKVYTLDARGEPKVVASKDEKDIGSPGGKVERDCIAKGVMFYGKDRESVSVVMPLRDRNGDPIAAARVVMETFTGQTEQNALARARPIVKNMQARVQSLQELTQ